MRHGKGNKSRTAKVQQAYDKGAPEVRSAPRQNVTWSTIAKKCIMHRSQMDMNESWRRQVADEELSLQELVSSVFKISDFDLTKTAELKSLPGAMLSGAVELARLNSKASIASDAANLLYDHGHPTWGSVDAYHAGFLTAKTVLAIFGIFVVSIEGSNFFLDLTPGKGDKDYVKKFKAESVGLEHPVRFMTIGGKRIEHRHVWEVISRIGNKCSVESLNEKEAFWLKHFDFSRYSSIRNKIIYTGYYWTSLGDLIRPIDMSEDVDKKELLANYHDNLWMENDLRDHIFMLIMKDFCARSYPYEA